MFGSLFHSFDSQLSRRMSFTGSSSCSSDTTTTTAIVFPSYEQETCKICNRNVIAKYNYGAMSCAACAAFYRRTVAKKLNFKCKEDPRCCDWNAILDVSTTHACKSCRMQRCVTVGMRDYYIKDKLPSDPQLKKKKEAKTLTVLAAVTEVVKKYILVNYEPKNRQASKSCSFLEHRAETEKDIQVFRLIIGLIPSLFDLDDQIKDLMCHYALGFYLPFLHAYSQSRASTSPFYQIHPNSHIEADFGSFLTSFGPDLVLKSPEKVHMQCTELINYVKNDIAPVVAEVVKTDEDFAAMLLMILIHCNDFFKDSRWQTPILRLKQAWNDVDLHYRESSADPSQWGNLILLLHSLNEVSRDYLRLSEIFIF